MECMFRSGDSIYPLKIEQTGENIYQIEMNGKMFECSIVPISPNCVSIVMEHESHTVFYSKENKSVHLFVHGEVFEFEDLTGRDRQTKAASGGEDRGAESKISAPMPGRILKILVEQGDPIEVNQPLFIVESMKMENEVRAHAAGNVKEIMLSENARVAVGDPIIELDLKE